MIGDLLTVNEAAQEMFLAGTEMGVGPHGVLVSFFGFPTMPKPVPAGPGGANRLPRSINIRWAGHPVLWLDEAQRLQHPEESEQAWLVRLYLELLTRGYIQEEEDGSITWTDALLIEDIDVENDDAAANRVKNWINGAADPLLDTLRLDDGSLHDMGGQETLEWEAKRLWLTYEQAWIRQAGHQQLQTAKVIAAGQALFSNPNQFNTLLQPWNSARARWSADPADQQLRFGLAEESQIAESKIITIQQHRAALASCLLEGADFSDRTQHQLQQEAELARDQGRSQELRGQVLRGDDTAVLLLDEHLHQWLQREIQEGTKLQQAGVGPRWINEQANKLEESAKNIERMLGEIGPPPGAAWLSNEAGTQ